MPFKHRARIDHDRMRHVERGAMIVAADQLDRTHQVFSDRDCRAGKGSTGWPYASARRRTVFPTPGARRKYLPYVRRAPAPRRTSRPKVRRRRSQCLPSSIFLTVSNPVAGLRSRSRVTSRLRTRRYLLAPPKRAISTDREDNHAKTSEEYSTEDSRRQCATPCPFGQHPSLSVGAGRRSRNRAPAAPAGSHRCAAQTIPISKTPHRSARRNASA